MERVRIETQTDIGEFAFKAAEILKRGGVILYPTDTIYGLGAEALSGEAVQKIYLIKGRDEGKPIHALVADIDMAAKYADLGKYKEAIANTVGQPVSWICAKQLGVGTGIAQNISTFGFRVPHNEFCLELLKAFGEPITATSANKSGESPKNSVEEILEQLRDGAQYIDLVIDAGTLPLSLPSTVVDLSSGTPTIVREGAVPKDEIERIFA
jgi:L-threonylcarbamoyladenylate synthase